MVISQHLWKLPQLIPKILSDLVEELGVHSEVEEDEVSDDKDVYLNEGDKKLQDVYEALLEDYGKYAKFLRV